MVEDKEEGKGGLAASEAMYFSTRVSEKGNPKLLYDLIRNQILLGASCVWTLSVIDPQTDPTYFATTSFDPSLFPLLLGAICSAPLVAAGYAISRSESRTWVDINSATSQLALRLFGGKKALATVAVTSSILGLITGAAEELSFRGLGMPLIADRIGLDFSSPSGLAAALLISSVTFGLGHWSWGGENRDNFVTCALQSCTGLYLGTTFVVAGGNVVVPGVAHAIYDAFTLLEAHVSAVSQIEYANEKSAASRLQDAVTSTLDEAVVENARNIFFLADTTRDTRLSIAEVRAAIRQLGSLISEEDLADIFAQSDSDGDGLLDLNDFFIFVALLKDTKTDLLPEQSSILW
eukprot:CAMPEP_0173071238 /NCGR_PEP_ID=MMETSP1102-20130122/9116_1 /TAXON_ID=49646 /ORGANISM="Geminigera sp., Strain Caron Lab Isolate" /LENGTH=348 /DNA_ID=CAMNT_0013939705 /DNA_START=180 /DNA_END=1226 /DNA_ORIENTATION=+